MSLILLPVVITVLCVVAVVTMLAILLDKCVSRRERGGP